MTIARSRIRPPAVAGRFFDDDETRCAAEARRLSRPYPGDALPGVLHGAVVPHAGWICSGRVAGATLATLAARTRARTFILTGTVHWFDLSAPAVDGAEAWRTPLGPVAVDERLRDAIARLDDFTRRDEAHRPEHSLEVQIPFLQCVRGDDLRIVPCLVPSRLDAPKWGERLGRLLGGWPEPVAVIASSDLTHYGPSYGFVPRGTGEPGHRWARDVNDRGLLDLVEAMDAEGILCHAREHRSACGGGAIAATVAACRALGASRGIVLDHTDSYRELQWTGSAELDNVVGYAGVVFG